MDEYCNDSRIYELENQIIEKDGNGLNVKNVGRKESLVNIL